MSVLIKSGIDPGGVAFEYSWFRVVVQHPQHIPFRRRRRFRRQYRVIVNGWRHLRPEVRDHFNLFGGGWAHSKIYVNKRALSDLILTAILKWPTEEHIYEK
jgi:hypothetical protein